MPVRNSNKPKTYPSEENTEPSVKDKHTAKYYRRALFKELSKEDSPYRHKVEGAKVRYTRRNKYREEFDE
jgi:hypothetical protein